MKNDYKGIPFWSWNDEIEEKELEKQITWMKETGLGGFFIHARAGLRTEYLGEKWFDCVEKSVKKAEELGLDAYVYDENGWPSGFVGGKLLDNIEFRDTYLTYKLGAFDENAYASYSNDGEKRVYEGNDCINVYLNYSVSTVDVLNANTVKAFIEQTHKEYKKRVKGIKGFFTDEPQFCAKGVAFSLSLVEYFKQEYGLDILDELGKLFVKAKDYRAFRYKYWKAMQSLMLKNYGKQLYDYCDNNGYVLTGHYYEERSIGKQILGCGGVMPFYEYMHIPGIDWLGKLCDEKTVEEYPEFQEFLTNDLAPKQLGSVAAQLGKKQVLTEMGAMLGWDETPKDLKLMAEFQFVNGVNTLCLHLIPYSENGQRKRDYPPHFSTVNPWVAKNFSTFNEYFGKLGKLLGNSEEIVNVGVLHPLRSGYFEFSAAEEKIGFNTADIDDPFFALLDLLAKQHISYHLIDETILAKHGTVNGAKLSVGRCKYDYLIVPKIYCIDKTTDKILQEYIVNGGKICMLDNALQYLEGEEHNFDYLKSNTTLSEIRESQPLFASDEDNLRVSPRVDELGNKYVYAVNLGGKCKVTFNANKLNSFKQYDVISGEYTNVSVNVEFDEGESKVLYFSEEELKTANSNNEKLILGKEFHLTEKQNNYMPLDFVEYSFNGVDYSSKIYHMALFDKLLNDRFSGTLFLKYSFEVKETCAKIKLIFENNNVESIVVNGDEVSEFIVEDSPSRVLSCNIVNNIKVGKNEIVLKVNYYQSKAVYYALFGDGVTESLRNCLVYDTTIEAIYLCGDFGVFGNFKPGKKDYITEGSDFYIAKQKEKVSDLIEGGFPFFRGDISLEQDIIVDNINKNLYFDKKFCANEVYLNGEYVGKMLFNNSLDLSKYLKLGKNRLKMILTVSNRNCLGENHSPSQEIYFLRPYNFERFGSWKNGNSKTFTEKYYFIRTII